MIAAAVEVSWLLTLTSGQSRLQDLTDVRLGAIGWIENATALSEGPEVVAQLVELFDATLYFGELAVDDLVDTSAWSLAIVADCDDIADLGQSEPR